MLNPLADLSGSQLYAHKKGFVWLCGLRECSSSVTHNLGTGHGLLLACFALDTGAPHICYVGRVLRSWGHLVLASWIPNNRGATFPTSQTETSRQAECYLHFFMLCSAARQDQKCTSSKIYIRALVTVPIVHLNAGHKFYRGNCVAGIRLNLI